MHWNHINLKMPEIEHLSCLIFVRLQIFYYITIICTQLTPNYIKKLLFLLYLILYNIDKLKINIHIIYEILLYIKI
jgi:hypothetical protein